MKTKYIIAAALGILIYACSPKMTSSGSSAPKVASNVAEGKIVYENNCAKCHKLFAPTDRTLEEWAPILVKMQKKAHLDDAQMALINAYISSETK